MSSTKTCDNPLCGCASCTCGTGCQCGSVSLGEFERRVMDVMWANAGRELTIREVADTFPDSAYTTIATILDRLVGKGLIVRSEDAKPIRFAALGSDDAYVALLMHKLLATTDHPERALARFVDTLSDNEMRAVQTHVRQLERRSR